MSYRTKGYRPVTGREELLVAGGLAVSVVLLLVGAVGLAPLVIGASSTLDVVALALFVGGQYMLYLLAIEGGYRIGVTIIHKG